MEYEPNLIGQDEVVEQKRAADPAIQELIEILYEQFDKAEFEGEIRKSHAAEFVSSNSSVPLGNVFSAYEALLGTKRIELPRIRGQRMHYLEKDHVVLLGVMGEVIKEDKLGTWRTVRWVEKAKEKLGEHPLVNYFKEPVTPEEQKEKRGAERKQKKEQSIEHESSDALDVEALKDLVDHPEGYHALSKADRMKIEDVFNLVNAGREMPVEFSPQVAAKWCGRLLEVQPHLSFEEVHYYLIKQREKKP